MAGAFLEAEGFLKAPYFSVAD
ncbi:hypothetical protein PBAL39_21575 [Pedobacter sp. BAL39]|nr:hypothetical protein PBAL39_21575 [Pedobacter sp. BAL39]